jgi:TM2 domain-containing membrane protein YozV
LTEMVYANRRCAAFTANAKPPNCVDWVLMSRAGNAAVLSLIIPGVGQFYNGHFWRGIFWLIIAPGLWIGSGGFLGWICHVVSAITAYKKAQAI